MSRPFPKHLARDWAKEMQVIKDKLSKESSDRLKKKAIEFVRGKSRTKK